MYMYNILSYSLTVCSIGLSVSLPVCHKCIAHVYLILDEGYWLGGQFEFHISVPEEYNIKVPTSMTGNLQWIEMVQSLKCCLSLESEMLKHG